MKESREEILQQRTWSEKDWYEYWKERTSHWTGFNSIQDIPDVPVVSEKIHKEVIIPALIRCGGVPKDKLIIGETYIGICRNASEAVWNGQEFEYQRHKFGRVYADTCNHFEDYTDYDVFVPIKVDN